MKAIINGLTAQFVDYTKEDLEFLKTNLTWESKEYGNQKEVQSESLLWVQNDVVFTLYGLAYLLQKLRPFDIENNNEEKIEQVDDIPLNYLPGIELWPHQVGAIKKIIALKRGICDIPTGGGKTEVMIGVLKYIFDHNLAEDALIVTPSVALAEQFHDRLILRGFNPADLGYYYSGSRDIDKKIVIGVINSLNNALSGDHGDNGIKITKKQVLFLDEVHHLRAYTFSNLTIKSTAKYFIGVSGSPFLDKNILKNSGDSLIYGLAGRIIFKVSMKFLYENWLVATPVVLYKSMPGKIPNYPGRYNTIYNRGIVNNDYRNQQIIDWTKRLNSNKMSVLILVQRLEHGIKLLEQLKTNRAICVYGGSTGYRWENEMVDSFPVEYNIFRENFEKGLYDVVIGSQVLDEGFDLPSVGAVILAGAGRSRIKGIQRLGRGIRKKKGFYNRVYIIDFADRDHVYLFAQYKARKELMIDMDAIILNNEKELLIMLQNHYKALINDNINKEN